MRLPVLALVLVATLSAASALCAEPVRLALSLDQGQTLTYTIEQEFEIAASIDQQEGLLASTRHEADVRLTARRLERDGSGVLTLAFDRIEIQADVAGRALAFEWTRPAEGDAAIVPTRESDRPGLILAGSILTVEIDAAGRVTDVSGLDMFLDETLAMGDAGPHFAGLFTPERLAATIESILLPDGSARNALREAGSEWTTTNTRAMPPVGVAELNTRWRLAEATDGSAVLTGTTTVAVPQQEDALDTTPRVRIEDQSHETRVQWDPPLGRLIGREARQSLTTVWTLGDQSVTQSQSSTLRVRRLDPASPGPADAAR